MRPVLDMVVVSHDVEGASYEELGWHVNSCLLCLFTVPAKPQKSGVYDGGGTHGLPRAQGSRIPHSSGGIGMHDIL
jgi:hypothetical protein